ncbi:S-methyl-5-thioribose-1-phosphate isomerase [Martiniozyma asiatica (nom. inval.)]|nr:S-methyl-5-thioribose-1-phosphate isomerase [Martiniozyma asiatica]
MSLEAIRFNARGPTLSILNQLQIPYETNYLDIDAIAPLDNIKETSFTGYEAIKGMYTRGAPAIMLVGCFSIVVELERVLSSELQATVFGYSSSDTDQFKSHLQERIDYLISSRPTAVNLANGCNQIKKIIKNSGDSLSELYNQILNFSVKLYEEDLQSNIAQSEHGLDYIISQLQSINYTGPFSVMTICNTGSLATSGHGTALGVIRHLNSKLSKPQSKLPFYFEHAYACETRPYNQGSRLTAYELAYEKIPFTLITDNMVSFLLSSLNRPQNHLNQNAVDSLPSKAPIMFILVGSDRIVKNGDLANKIGTYQLSLIAKQFDEVKFVGVAPTTTIDSSTSSGVDIKIEERPKNELTEVMGAKVEDGEFVRSNGEIVLQRIRMAPLGINVWNPSFDVTPHENIDCIVTENGFITKDSNGEFHL